MRREGRANANGRVEEILRGSVDARAPEVESEGVVRVLSWRETREIDAPVLVSQRGKQGCSAGFCLVRVDRERLVGAPPTMAYPQGRAAERALSPRVDQGEDEGGVHRDGGVKRRRQPPGPKAHAGNALAARAGRMQRDERSVAGDQVTAGYAAAE